MFEVVEYWGMCKCASKPRPVRAAIGDLLDEVGEFIVHPSYDEASDIAFCIGRLLGGLVGKVYISIPGDQMTLEKMRDRMQIYQCIQSRRHLKNGRCPES
jgi:hypothetical protein